MIGFHITELRSLLSLSIERRDQFALLTLELR